MVVLLVIADGMVLGLLERDRRDQDPPDAGFSIVPRSLLGIMTAVGGGAGRDGGRPRAVFGGNNLYATPAFTATEGLTSSFWCMGQPVLAWAHPSSWVGLYRHMAHWRRWRLTADP